eukprot:jgi/Phyca11/114421/e_gw1.26.503.1
MKVFRTAATEAYRDLKGVQRYQIFEMSKEKPGVVICRVGPANKPVDQDLRRSFDGIPTDASKQLRPYVPAEFASDPLYAAPTDEEERLAKEDKQAPTSAQPKTGTRSRKRAKKDKQANFTTL